MDHPGAVGGVQGGRDLLDDGDRARCRQRPGAAEHRPDVLAFDEPHIDVELAVDLTVIVDGHDVWFGQPARGLGFALHAAAKDVVGTDLFGYQLERHHAVLDGVVGLVHLAHSAAAQQAAQLVVPESTPDPRFTHQYPPASSRSP
ncbi:hypothetical protein MSTO_10530 [Mycobacterium stomatepiae]|uniref:Uncharacterized protein n=1 Tax=Mycobacterium stomatepiae TaxID=470076 RepID=A0A7I7Q3J2_9MYCO|nr:hypothetical protein MSTO_10530 [Mycobacterium stomatepiae]